MASYAGPLYFEVAEQRLQNLHRAVAQERLAQIAREAQRRLDDARHETRGERRWRRWGARRPRQAALPIR